MPEGDTIHNAARRLREALVGAEIESIETPHPRFGGDRWPERLGGQAVTAVDAHGKHLLVHFDGGLAIHSHLRMGGAWGVYPRGRRWHRARRRAWLVLRTARHEVVQFDGPVLELMTEGRTRIDPRLTALGPDILAPELDEQGFLRRLREGDPTRGIGEALLDQRNIAGIGNIWKSEGCFMAGLDPWQRVAEVTDEQALEVLRRARPLMQRSAERGGRVSTVDPTGRHRGTWVYGREGMPCRHCATPLRSRGQGDDNRTTYWCPRCQS